MKQSDVFNTYAKITTTFKEAISQATAISQKHIGARGPDLIKISSLQNPPGLWDSSVLTAALTAIGNFPLKPKCLKETNEELSTPLAKKFTFYAMIY